MKEKNRKRVLASTAAAMLIAMCAGCGTEPTQTAELADSVTFPIADDYTMKIWTLNENSSVVKSYNELGMYKELEKRTGIKLEFLHPTAGQVSEQFNIMIASGEYPDIIERFANSYSGGFAKGYNDGVILELTDLVEKYAPNLSALYEEYPQLRMEASSDEGKMYSVPMIRGGNVVRTYKGPIIRADYLEKFGLSVPETIDEWENMLRTFKQNGIEIPFVATTNLFKSEAFIGAYGLGFEYFLEDGKVVYGRYDDRFKDYVKKMADWYAEGLIDPEVTTNNDSKTYDSKVLTKGAGSFIGSVGSYIGGYLSQMAEANPEFDLVAAPFPTLNKGDEAYMIHRDPLVQANIGSVITTTCQRPDYAMAFLDYAFSKEGHLLSNFGVEGESYTMVDGQPVFTEEVTKNSEGLTMAKAGGKYCRSFTWGTFVQDKRYGEQFYSNPRQKEATETWTKTVSAYEAHNPYLRGELTPEESESIASAKTEMSTYAGEMFSKWVMGQRNVEDDWDEYKVTLEQMGVQKVVDTYQAAYDRYIKTFPEMANPKEFEVSDWFINME